MQYLLYMQDGFPKKLPLTKQQLSLGRTNENDISIDNSSISRNHLSIEVGIDSILIKDLNSINGSYFKGNKIKNVEIKVGESFFLGEMEFVFQVTNSDDFDKSKNSA